MFLLYLLYFYLNIVYMTNLEEIKYFFIEDLIKKKQQKKIWNQTYKQKNKEKKRQMIEQIKKERQENSLIFNQF